MILSVTLNPCLDKTLNVPAWTLGENVRGTALREVVGGKGNNVARALKRLGRDARPVTFLGGEIGRLCERLLRDEDGLEPVAISTVSPTRVILTTRTASNEQTAFFDPNPSIRPEEAHALLHEVETRLRSGTVEALTLSGSSPHPSTHGLFGELIGLAKARRVPVFLDTYGPSLDAIWGFRPDFQQFNRREAALSMGLIRADDSAVERVLQDWSKRGVKVGIVTDGPLARLGALGGRDLPRHSPGNRRGKPDRVG